MLRLIVIVLLLANGAYLAWSQGYLALFGLAPVAQTEPARMQAQIKPEAIALLNAADPRRPGPVATAPPAPPLAPAKPAECLQSPPLAESQAQAVRSAVQALPAGSWALDVSSEPARWIIYMGKFQSSDVLAKKKTELRQLSVAFEPLQNASLEPGISLGGHASQNDAERELADLNKRGVRTAKVVQEKPATPRTVLRLPAVDDALRARLEPVKAALGSAALRGCSVPN